MAKKKKGAHHPVLDKQIIQNMNEGKAKQGRNEKKFSHKVTEIKGDLHTKMKVYLKED